MLSEYNSQDAVGSAMEEAQKTANSWEGQLNKLSNTWTKFVQNFVDTDFVKTGISGVSSFIDILDKLIDKFGILGGVITPIVATVMTVKNKGITDIFNSFKSSEKYKSIETGLFGTSKVLSTEDVASLKNYNELLKQGKSSAEAFDIALGNSNNTVKQMAINASGSAVKLQTMTVAERVAATGAKLLGGALKIATGFLIGIAIDAVITWIDNLVHAEENAKEKLEELYTQSKETTQKNLDEVKTLQENLKTYQELSKKVSLTAQDKETLLSIQNDLINKYGIEAKNIDLLTGKYKENNAELEKIIVNKAKAALTSAKTEYETAKTKSASEYTDKTLLYTFKEVDPDFEAQQRMMDTNATKGMNLYEALGYAYADVDKLRVQEDEYYDIISKSANKLTFNSEKGGISKIHDIYLRQGLSVKEQVDTLQEILDNLNKYTTEEDKSSQSYIDLRKKLTDMLKSRQENLDAINKSLGDVANAEIILYQANNPIDTKNITKDQYEKWKNNLLSQFDNDSDLKSAIQSQLEITFSDLELKFEVKKEDKTPSFDITQYSEDIDNLQTKIKSLKDTLSNLKDGTITDDELIDFTQEYGLTEYINDIPKLQSELEKLIQTSPDELINKLWELRKSLGEADKVKVDNLINRLEQLTNTSENIGESAKKVKEYSDKIKLLASTINGLSTQINDLNKTIDNLKEKQSDLQDENSGLQQAYEYLIDKQIDKINDEITPHQKIIDELELENELLQIQNDNYQLQLDKIEEEISKYQTASNTVQDYIDKQTHAIEDSYQARIDKIQEENDAINEQIDLQQKLDNLHNARRKKVRVYTEQGGYQLGNDTSAIQSAENEYRDTVTSKRISYLEKERDAKIKSWEDYAQRWSDTVDKISGKADELTTKEVLGSDWRTKITNKDVNTLNNFSKKYNDYVNKQKIVLENKIKNNEKDIKKNDEVINSKKKVIESKNAVLDKWNDYKDQLSSIVSEVENSNNSYISNLKSLTGSENLTLEDRNKNLEAFKNKYSQNVKDINNITNSLKIYEDEKTEAENTKKKYENLKQKYTNLKKKYSDKADSVTSIGTKVATYDVKDKDNKVVKSFNTKKAADEFVKTEIETLVAERVHNDMMNYPSYMPLVETQRARTNSEQKWKQFYNNYYKVIAKYKNGGIADYTGIAQLDGTPSQPEVIFNSSQAKKLYDFVANTRNLSEVIGDKIANHLANNTINNIVNKSNDNSTYVINIDKIITPNPNNFANQMSDFVRQLDRNRMIGK